MLSRKERVDDEEDSRESGGAQLHRHVHRQDEMLRRQLCLSWNHRVDAGASKLARRTRYLGVKLSDCRFHAFLRYGNNDTNQPLRAAVGRSGGKITLIARGRLGPDLEGVVRPRDES